MTTLDIFIDADESYTPVALPKTTVRMGGKEYVARCPKDTLPIFLGRIQAKAQDDASAEGQENLFRELLRSAFSDEDAEEIWETSIDPKSPIDLAFIVHTMEQIQAAYEPHLEAQYAEMGMESPARKPQDRLKSTKPRKALPAGTKKTAKKTAAKKAAAKKKATTA